MAVASLGIAPGTCFSSFRSRGQGITSRSGFDQGLTPLSLLLHTVATGALRLRWRPARRQLSFFLRPSPKAIEHLLSPSLANSHVAPPPGIIICPRYFISRVRCHACICSCSGQHRREPLLLDNSDRRLLLHILSQCVMLEQVVDRRRLDIPRRLEPLYCWPLRIGFVKIPRYAPSPPRGTSARNTSRYLRTTRQARLSILLAASSPQIAPQRRGWCSTKEPQALSTWLRPRDPRAASTVFDYLRRTVSTALQLIPSRSATTRPATTPPPPAASWPLTPSRSSASHILGSRASR